jgi:hypothetical protein
MPEVPWEYLFVVYRVDRGHWHDSSKVDINECVTIKEVLPTAENAQEEVERLRALNGGKGAEYYYQQARYYRGGRHVESATDE